MIETEGGHVDFAPLDSLEDKILDPASAPLPPRLGRADRVGAGPQQPLRSAAAIEGRDLTFHDEKALWAAALDGEDSLAAAALDRFCLALGAVAGDIALAQGAEAVVIAGGLGLRLADYLPRSGFRDRFIAKGRFERRMDEMPVKLITHPQPGLFGAAAAFAEGASDDHRRNHAGRPGHPGARARRRRRLGGARARHSSAPAFRCSRSRLRTPAALDAIRQMSQVPGAIVGAGTVLNEAQLAQAIDAGSRFIVSPGLTDPLAIARATRGSPICPASRPPPTSCADSTSASTASNSSRPKLRAALRR